MIRNIIGLTKKQILGLTANDIGDRDITKAEFFYMANMLGAHWAYDYDAAKKGKPGKHALLKSLRHSDQFFISRILLSHENIRKIIAHQLVRVFKRSKTSKPDRIAGIPDGATELGKDVAIIMGVKYVEMQKIDGKISLTENIPPWMSLLLVEDFCTRGTGFIEAVKDIALQCPKTRICPFELVILNRGGLTAIEVDFGGGLKTEFSIAALVTEKIEDWDGDDGSCEPCKLGSIAIKPKETDENWEDINTAQL